MPHIPTEHLPPPLHKLLAPLLSQEPAAQLIRIQIEQSGQLLAVALMGAALNDWDEPGLASP
ncbi:MAG: hypothetical protein KFB97_04665 [Cyanobium sp. M30B3]|nr:MAG: hypothetical protein KFB97_04665 [Cyanobium sp. M30B3]